APVSAPEPQTRKEIKTDAGQSPHLAHRVGSVRSRRDRVLSAIPAYLRHEHRMVVRTHRLEAAGHAEEIWDCRHADSGSGSEGCYAVLFGGRDRRGERGQRVGTHQLYSAAPRTEGRTTCGGGF